MVHEEQCSVQIRSVVEAWTSAPAVMSKDYSVNVYQIKIFNFCETIQKSVVTFSNTLEKSYAQKNEILAGE